MIPVSRDGETAANLNQLIPNIPSDFEGSVEVNFAIPSLLVALDVLPGVNGSFALANVRSLPLTTKLPVFPELTPSSAEASRGRPGRFP